MKVEARMRGEPSLDVGVFVGSVVVDDEVEIQAGGKLPVEPPEEAQKLLMAVPWHALAHDGSFQHIESGE